MYSVVIEVKTSGSVMVTDVAALQPTESVIVTPYEPAGKLEAVGVTCEPAPASHCAVKNPYPPTISTVAAPSVPALQETIVVLMISAEGPFSSSISIQIVF